MNETFLEEAARLTSRDRNEQYGSPLDGFAKVAAMTKPIDESKLPSELKQALRMVQVKISRLLHSPYHRDSLADAVGYLNTYQMVLAEQRHRETLTETFCKVDEL